MAKIRVKGDTSGYIDIAAPDVAGAATVNLDKIAQTDQTVNFTSNVGIGTASPSRVLDIVATGSTPPRITGTSNNGGYLDFHNNAATSGRYRIGQGYATATDNIGFLNNEANAPLVFGTNNTERMRIDASGRVTKPYQPAFCVHGTGGSFVGVNVSGADILNNGSHFNTTTGRFTAPIDGMYCFSINLTTEDTNSHFSFIAVNGASVAGLQLSYGVVYQSATQTVIVSLSAGDYVEAQRRGTSYNVYRAVFSGYLLG